MHFFSDDSLYNLGMRYYETRMRTKLVADEGMCNMLTSMMIISYLKTMPIDKTVIDATPNYIVSWDAASRIKQTYGDQNVCYISPIW